MGDEHCMVLRLHILEQTIICVVIKLLPALTIGHIREINDKSLDYITVTLYTLLPHNTDHTLNILYLASNVTKWGHYVTHYK